MPVIQVVLNELDHQRLEQAHGAVVKSWPQLGHRTQPPTFAAWMGGQLAQTGTESDDALLGDIRVFSAIERLVTSLPQHGFHLAHTAVAEVDPQRSCESLAKAIVDDFKLGPHYAKRLQELFAHYLKGAREIADTAQVGITNRAYGALTEAHRKLTERTGGAIARLGADKAIGRVEGATAMLVGLEVMDRATAKKRTSAFSAQARAVRKSGWVGKMFGEN